MSPRRPLAALLPLATALLVAGCGDRTPTDPSTLHYGQVGEVRLQITTPITLGLGTLRQSIVWASNGEWVLEEAISYRGVIGDVYTRPDQVNDEISAGLYAQWITQVNMVPALELFLDGLDPSLSPTCGPTESRISLTIVDAARDERISWDRCGSGPLQVLTPEGAGPDPLAPRVVNAATLLRDYTLGEDFLSAFRGSVPFATIERGEDTPANLIGPRTITSEQAWRNFWLEHRGTEPPDVDFETQVVLVASVGEVEEAGIEVDVRRILPVEDGSIIEISERVPGDFCSPASRRGTPYHIVVAPLIPQPIRFAEIRVERVPCGG